MPFAGCAVATSIFGTVFMVGPHQRAFSERWRRYHAPKCRSVTFFTFQPGAGGVSGVGPSRRLVRRNDMVAFGGKRGQSADIVIRSVESATKAGIRWGL